MAWLRGQIASIEARLARPLGAKADKRAGLVRGYATRGEWHAKSRRLQTLKDRLAVVEADWAAGRVRVVRGGKRLANTRHHLEAAGLDEQAWRERWRAERMFLAADGESGKRFGNETIRVTDTGQVSIKLPAPLAHLANAPHGRYVLDATVRVPAPGAGVARPDHREPGGGLPHPPRPGARPLVCHRLLAARRRPGPAAGGGAGAGGGGGGHERRPPRRLAPGCARQPGRRTAALLLRPDRHRRSTGTRRSGTP